MQGLCTDVDPVSGVPVGRMYKDVLKTRRGRGGPAPGGPPLAGRGGVLCLVLCVLVCVCVVVRRVLVLVLCSVCVCVAVLS